MSPSFVTKQQQWSNRGEARVSKQASKQAVLQKQSMPSESTTQNTTVTAVNKVETHSIHCTINSYCDKARPPFHIYNTRSVLPLSSLSLFGMQDCLQTQRLLTTMCVFLPSSSFFTHAYANCCATVRRFRSLSSDGYTHPRTLLNTQPAP